MLIPVLLRARLGWRGQVNVGVYRDGQLVDHVSIRNLITDDGLNLVRDALKGDVADTGIKYLAWGNDDTAPTASDTALGNEQGRRQITSRSIPGTGALQSTTIIASTEANDQIEELGFFAGADATAAAGSGVLLARVLYSRLKSDQESIQVDRTGTLAR